MSTPFVKQEYHQPQQVLELPSISPNGGDLADKKQKPSKKGERTNLKRSEERRVGKECRL